MAIRIRPKRSSVTGAVPTTTDLIDGEMAVNTTDRKLFVRAGLTVVDMFSALARLASPAFTGAPTAPTPTAGDNSTKLATTAFVTAAVAAGGGGTVGFEIDGGNATTSYAGVPAFDFGSAT